MKISHVRWTFYVIFLANQTSHLPKIRGPLALKTIDQQNEIFDEASKFNNDYKLAMGVAARACNPRELEHIPDQIAQAASLVRTRKSDTFVCLIWRCKKSWCWTSDGPNFWTELYRTSLVYFFGYVVDLYASTFSAETAYISSFSGKCALNELPNTFFYSSFFSQHTSSYMTLG